LNSCVVSVLVQRTEADSICIQDMLPKFCDIYTMVDWNLKGYPAIPINILSDLFGSRRIKNNADLPSKKVCLIDIYGISI
jgi:hypothetical protein